MRTTNIMSTTNINKLCSDVLCNDVTPDIKSRTSMNKECSDVKCKDVTLDVTSRTNMSKVCSDVMCEDVAPDVKSTTNMNKVYSDVTCNDVTQYVSRYWENKINDRIDQQVRVHLAQCPGCNSELELFNQVTAGVKDLPEIEPRPNFTNQIMVQIKENEKKYFP